MDFTKIKRHRWLSMMILGLIAFSCGTNPKTGLLNPPGGSGSTSYSGYVIVGNNLNQTVSLLDPSLNFVKQLLVLDGTTTDTPYGIAVYDSDNILVSVDGTDRIVKVNLTRGSGSDSIFYMNTALLTGNLRNITRLTSGDILIVETSNIERFTAAGLRVTTGAWPKALQTVGTGLERIPSGGFVHCSTTTDVVRTYSDDGTQIATQASGIAGTTDVIDCAAAPDGRIAAAFSGTTDTIRIYTSSTLASVSCNFSDVGLVGAPAAIAFRPNGNLLITDSTNNTFTEIDTSCTLVQSFSSPFLATPTSLRVMP